MIFWNSKIGFTIVNLVKAHLQGLSAVLIPICYVRIFQISCRKTPFFGILTNVFTSFNFYSSISSTISGFIGTFGSHISGFSGFLIVKKPFFGILTHVFKRFILSINFKRNFRVYRQFWLPYFRIYRISWRKNTFQTPFNLKFRFIFGIFTQVF